MVKEQKRVHERVCPECNTLFTVPATRQHNATKYCSDKCRKQAKREQDLIAQRKYQKKYRWLLKDADKWNRLGSSKLGVEPAKDFEEEARLIKNELKRIKR